MSLPPTVFVAGARGAAQAASSKTGWTRVIVEKPFGRDLESSREMTRGLAQYISEDQTYRIDHYLGKARGRRRKRGEGGSPSSVSHHFAP